MSSFSDESDPVFEMIDSLSEKELDALPYGIIQLGLSRCRAPI